MAGGLGHTRQYQLTLSGAAQSLTDAIATDLSLLSETDRNPVFRSLSLQADDGNSNPVFCGADSAVSAANHGFRIPTPVTAIPELPYVINGPGHVGDVWVLGTADEKLNIFVVLQ